MEVMKPMKLLSVMKLSSENTNASLAPSPSEVPLPAEWEMVYTIIPPYIFTLSLLGLLFNSFVLGVYVVHKDRLTVAEIYLSNLALADFILLCGLPFWAMNILNNFNWPYGEPLCKLVNSIITINYYTSSYTLVMISVDRYLALVKTMKARWLRRTLYAKVICFILWIFGLFLSAATLVHRKVKFITAFGTMSCILDYSHGSSWKFGHQIVMNMVGFVIPLLVIVFSSGNIIKALARRKVGGGGFHDTNDTKAVILVYAVTLVFFLCWGPYQVFTFLDTLCDAKLLDEEAWDNTLNTGGQVSVYLAFLNSALNPLLYVFSGQYFRRKLCSIYRRKRRQRRGSDMTTYQRSMLSTYVNRTDQIKNVVIVNQQM
ncbi:B1 bradykinin receptor-like [Brachionichthys hirsutus]|uniref:B1 bradykinin receptor-like n=1 Tax=Brachionichthys hirsutus TaxID=412623 RepID=UPI003604D17D